MHNIKLVVNTIFIEIIKLLLPAAAEQVVEVRGD